MPLYTQLVCLIIVCTCVYASDKRTSNVNIDSVPLKEIRKHEDVLSLLTSMQARLEALERQGQHDRERISSLEKEITKLYEHCLTVNDEESHTDERTHIMSSLLSKAKPRMAKRLDGNNFKNNTGNVIDTHVLQDQMQTQKVRRIRSKRSTAGQVAFSAYLSHPIDPLPSGQVIKCDQTLLNDGAGYNRFTGIFTAPVSGVYLLSFSINSYRETHVKLLVDGANTADVVSDPYQTMTEFEIMTSNTILVKLSSGQSVWMEEYHNGNGMVTAFDEYRLVTFAGVLLY
ncbi:hypothetical protein DPMN_108517 [Dreissena polymorpha]|uniref:C1q domain-containing protein n=1 Tax=Dreissena polymorpha TaxID=45954 RepID=A0A9D4QM51_DREPO|nr:hypothetical protein DPMN_108517 [Dreissena polymorpha]